MKSKRGITLIALIITIIVMLILVTVTISMAVNGGLFGYARNAAVGTNQAIRDEENLGNVPAGLSTDDLIDFFTEEEPENTEEDLANLRTVYIGNVSDAGIESSQTVNGSQATYFDCDSSYNYYIKYKNHLYIVTIDDNTFLADSVNLSPIDLSSLGLQSNNAFVTIRFGTKAQGEYTVSGSEYIVSGIHYYADGSTVN